MCLNGKISYHIQVHLRGGSRLQCLCLHPGDCTARSTDQLVDVTQRQQDGYITAPQSPVSQCCVRKEVLAWRGVQWLRSHVPIADEGGYTLSLMNSSPVCLLVEPNNTVIVK